MNTFKRFRTPCYDRIMKLLRGPKLEKIEELLKYVDNGRDGTRELVGTLDSPYDSENQLRYPKNLAISLNFLEEDESRLKITERGKQVLEGKKEEAYRKSVKELESTRTVLKAIIKGELPQDNVASTECGSYLEELMGKEYQSSRPRKSASTMFRIFEQADLGTVEKQGRANVFNPDLEAIQQLLDLEEKGNQDVEGSDLENASAHLDLDEQELVIKVSTDGKSVEEVKAILDQIAGGRSGKLELK